MICKNLHLVFIFQNAKCKTSANKNKMNRDKMKNVISAYLVYPLRHLILLQNRYSLAGA